MPKVSDLKLELQQGSDNTLVATWGFAETSSGSTTTTKAKVGDTVTIKSGAKYYTGQSIPTWVMNKRWIVSQVSGNRAVINRSTDGANAINSPVHVDNLIVVGSTQTNTTTNNLDHYNVRWFYSAGTSVWFDGGSSDIDSKDENDKILKNATYSIPSNATKVKCTVKPVSKTYESNGQSTPYWTGTAVTVEYLVDALPPAKLSAPAVLLEKFTLKATLENIEDEHCDEVEFEVYKGDAKFTSGVQSVITARATYSCSVEAGFKYRVRCRAINLYDNTKVYGEWSPYSSEVETIPSTVTDVKCEVQADKTVRVSWTGSDTAKSYTIEYTTNKLYFDSSSEVSSLTVENTYGYVTGLQQGEEWYFRVRASNDHGDSGWSDIVYKVVGTKPQPPTTWSLTTSAVIGDKVVLYWVHNSEDGSKQTEANIELIINSEAEIITVNTENENKDEKDNIYSYEVDLSEHSDGAEILWRVRTRGITFDYSDWSVQRTINVYAPPTAELHIGNDISTLNTFPLDISILAGPSSQAALSYYISIKAEDTYVTQDQIGNDVTVNAGTEVYSKVFSATGNTFNYSITPDEITLENNQFYLVEATVVMNSGLIATAAGSFGVSWAELNYEPNAAVTIDSDTLCAYIKPFCLDYDSNLVSDLALSVYRREFDGSFTLIAEEIDNDGSVTITDPHPSLDYARYRIVARNKNTSVNSYVDLPGLPVGETSIVIQWDEKWSRFDYSGEDDLETQPWTGSMLKLPYNVEVSESFNPDKSLVEYIGRKSPVSYYGTQEGIAMNLNAEFPKDDKELLYTIRRLATWKGNVYVREPSGNGYNASITVSMSNKYSDVTTPVTFSVERVEGDI
jgi:hypothetical protein